MPKRARLCIDPDPGATWRSGYATVCKTVYTSSILVVASINVIKYFHIILKKLLQVDGAVAEVRGAGTGCKSRSWSDFAKRPIGPRPETCMENFAL